MFNKNIKLFLVGFICLALSGCLGFGSLNYKQVKMLKQQSFILTEEGWSLGLPERLLFEFDQSEISNQNLVELNHLAAQLHKYKLNKVRIVGHTDNTGNPNYNLALSEKRAQSVAQVFMNNQFTTQNIQVIGRGSSQPLNTTDSHEARAENRRVAVIITP